MKTFIVFFAIFGVLLAEENKKYTTKYDNIDVDVVLKTERLLNNYIGCLLNENPCTPDAAELKKNLPDALATDCTACSEAQKVASDKFSQYMIEERPDDWNRLENKYDPSGAYKTRYLEEKSKKSKKPN
uniref:Chemosensory protein 8 n=1 Tax=Cephus cinctus TaxID=211228 RepID=A0A1W6L1C2_CEPCN|nr:chemosensory protein 8 [Cephus cinctus]